jgi:hypothetical protein
MSAGALAVTASLLAAVPAAAGGLTVTVPGDYDTIQEAVDAVQSDVDPGEVIVESDGVFDEAVLIQQSVTLRAGEGFSPTIERNGTVSGPLRISAAEDEETEVAVLGLTLRLIDGNSVVSIRNESEDELLEVRLEGVTIEGQSVSQGVAAASGEGDVALFVLESTVEVVGAGAGAPVCLRLEPFGFNLGAALAANRFRFSRAGGLRVQGGDNGDTVGVLAIANVFEGFESGGFGGGGGIRLAGFNNPDVNLSSGQLALFSNLLVDTNVGIELRSTFEHQIALTANNNTVVDSGSDAIFMVAQDDSTMTVNLTNNVVVGSQGSDTLGGSDGVGVHAQVVDRAIIDLVNDHNLLFDNEGGDYAGVAMPGASDVFADPRFIDPAQGDYHLAFGSPAIDAGDNDPPGGNNSVDLDLGPRIVDGDGDGTAIVDLGAYEAPVPDALQIPTLSTFALLGFAALLAAAAAWRLRRRPV